MPLANPSRSDWRCWSQQFKLCVPKTRTTDQTNRGGGAELLQTLLTTIIAFKAADFRSRRGPSPVRQEPSGEPEQASASGYPRVPMVQATDEGDRHDPPALREFDLPRIRRIRIEAAVRPGSHRPR